MHSARSSRDTFIESFIFLAIQAVLYIVSILHLAIDFMLISSTPLAMLDRLCHMVGLPPCHSQGCHGKAEILMGNLQYMDKGTFNFQSGT